MRSFWARGIGALLLAVLLIPAFTSCGEPAVPENYVRDLTWAVGTELPAAEDFAIPNAPKATYRFSDNAPYEKIRFGSNLISIRVKPSGKRAFTYEAVLTLIRDSEAPTATGISDREATLGDDGVSYWSGVDVTDNCDNPISRTVEAEDVHLDRVGVYPIVYRLTDAAGNTKEYSAKLEVVDREFEEAEFNRRIDGLIDSLGLRGLSKLEQCKKIYTYVNDQYTIGYSGDSNLALRTNWMREAELALDSKKGDCYTYFALSKAFLERLGIENIDVQRTPGYTEDTHFWSMVNVGTAENPRWYHFDATRLKDKVYDYGILTDAQAEAYSRDHKPYFYAYDRSGYPRTDTVEVSHEIR